MSDSETSHGDTKVSDIFGDDLSDLEEQNNQINEKENDEVNFDNCSIPSIKISNCSLNAKEAIHFMKVPSFFSVERRQFSNQTIEDDFFSEDFETNRSSINVIIICIRWRKVGDKIESNSRIVTWSNGSQTLHIGNEIFEILCMPIQEHTNHLYIKHEDNLIGKEIFKCKVSFRPYSTNSETHKKITLNVSERFSKLQKVQYLPASINDPEAERQIKLKLDEERLRIENKKEASNKRKGGKFSNLFNDQFIDDHVDDDQLDEDLMNAKRFAHEENDDEGTNDHCNEDNDDDDDLELPYRRRSTIRITKHLDDDDEDN